MKFFIFSLLFIVSSCTLFGQKPEWGNIIENTVASIEPPRFWTGKDSLEIFLGYQHNPDKASLDRLTKTLDYAIQMNVLEIVYRQFPKNGDTDAYNASMSALCVHAENKFLDYQKWLPFLLASSHSNNARIDDYINIAIRSWVNMEKMRTCMEAMSFKDRVSEDIGIWESYWIVRTPAIVLNNKVVHTNSIDDIIKFIDNYIQTNKTQTREKTPVLKKEWA